MSSFYNTDIVKFVLNPKEITNSPPFGLDGVIEMIK